MTRAAFLFAVAALAYPAAAAPVPAGLDASAYYYPTRVGDRMTYQSSGGEIVHVVTGVERKGDARVVTVWGSEGGGKLAPVAAVEASGKELVVLQEPVAREVPDGKGGRTTQPRLEDRAPLVLLKLPPAPGQKWDAVLSPGVTASCVAGKEEAVKVPAGEFRAVPVDLHLPPPNPAGSSVRVWLARGVGPVKLEGQNHVTVVLKSFTAGKD